MTRVFDGPLWVHYGQAYLVSGEEYPVPETSFRGQTNGLCGAAAPGVLFLVTGLHTGEVGFTVDLLDSPPAPDERWEEVVEVSFTPTGPDVALMQWAGEGVHPLPLAPGNYRARYCAHAMDAGHQSDTNPDDGTLIDHYALFLWPAAPAPDVVLRQTSDIAAYWHDVARTRHG